MTAAERLRGARAVVVGDVMLDEHVWGQVSRISPEAPVPVVEIRGRSHVPGGAGNTAAGIVALGGSAILAGVVGKDAAATDLRAALDEHGVVSDGLVADAGRATTAKTRVIAHGQQVVRLDAEDRQPLSHGLGQQLLAWLETHLDSADVVVVSDYRKGVVTEQVAAGVIERAARAGKPVVVDPKTSDYARYRGATVLTPNVHDAKRAVHIAPDEFADLDEVARRLERLLPDTAVLVTRGSEGMSLVRDGGRLDVPAEAHEVYDVTGAGDTVVAALAVALARGLPLEDAVRVANAAAGIAVSKLGTATVSLEELSERLDDVAVD